MDYRAQLKNKKRIVIKVGSSTLTHAETGELDLIKMERLVRELTNLRNQGKDVVLVTSGAIAVGRQAAGFTERPKSIASKQACAAIGQGRLMMVYTKLFSEYSQIAAQILMTRNTMVNPRNRHNALNTFEELMTLGAIPIVNENDTISTYELNHLEQFGDNDTLSSVVAALIHADLLILLSDIDGLFTDDPNRNPEARFISLVEEVNDEMLRLGKDTDSSVGTGGMATKLTAARLATTAGADMIIANGRDVGVLHRIMEGENEGTLFLANPEEEFRLERFLEEMK